MEKINLCAATKKDAPVIRTLIYEVGINPIGLNWRRFTLAVNEHGDMIGCGQIKPHSDGSHELASIAVQPGYHGLGIGSQLVLALIETADPPLYLTCRAELQSFYARFGFVTLTPERMPPYFRRIARLAAFLQTVIPSMGQLRVMRRG